MSALDRELDAWAMQHVGTAAANDLFDIVGRMLAAEREACAKIADEHDGKYQGNDVTSVRIAAAIRRQGQGEKG